MATRLPPAVTTAWSSCGIGAPKNAIAAGGQHAMESQDHGFMYGWSFYDIDGHHWEVFWMDPSAT